ncbi:MAG: hypothetical protein ACRD0G_14380, partial [Acidimicrobiales bacterium]
MTSELISPPPALPRPEDEERPPDAMARLVTALVVGLPLIALVLAVIRFWGHGVQLRDLVLAVVLYLLVGHGMSIGFHRLLAHKSFAASRPLKLVLVALGSMAYDLTSAVWLSSGVLDLARELGDRVLGRDRAVYLGGVGQRVCRDGADLRG